MSGLLRDVSVLVVDCQAGGATPAQGDLLELGWALVGPGGALGPVRSHWIARRSERPVPSAIRRLTGWREDCAAGALAEGEAWARLLADVRAMPAGAPTAIHYARFELPFLRDVHERLAQSQPFPLDVVCLHAMACRLFTDLPRRNIRALAGYLGHRPTLLRRAAGHVEASAFIWTALVPLLEQASVRTWEELRAWLQDAPPRARSLRRVYPLAAERRLLPDRPGVYRFVRRNGEVIYVGKAASLKKRVVSHFAGGARKTERELEMLTQVHDVEFTETASVLEAALLESDEIKRLDPPYNVQLRSSERSAWFAARDLRRAAPRPDEAFYLGPLPSERALVAFCAIVALEEGAALGPDLCADALAVPVAYLPGDALFAAGWSAFSAEHIAGYQPNAARRVLEASRTLWMARGRAESDRATTPPGVWDGARVRRRLERHLVQGGLLLRRARALCLLCDAAVAFREGGGDVARVLIMSHGKVVERRDVAQVTEVAGMRVPRPSTIGQRRACFDGAGYDRMRVLLTELRRILEEQGEVAVRVGAHLLAGPKLARWMDSV